MEAKMARETINSIKEAETKAQQIIKDAEAESRAIIEKAREEVKEYENKLVSDARARAKAAVEDASSGEDDAMEAVRRRAVAVIAQQQDGFEEKRAKAIDLIISEITG